MAKAVVIGGSGFLGSHIADELSCRGHDVTIFDHKESPWLSKSQTMVVGDILNQGDLFPVVKHAKYLYLLAGVADIEESRAHPFAR